MIDSPCVSGENSKANRTLVDIDVRVARCLFQAAFPHIEEFRFIWESILLDDIFEKAIFLTDMARRHNALRQCRVEYPEIVFVGVLRHPV